MKVGDEKQRRGKWWSVARLPLPQTGLTLFTHSANHFQTVEGSSKGCLTNSAERVSSAPSPSSCSSNTDFRWCYLGCGGPGLPRPG